MDRKTVPNDILIPQVGQLLSEGREVEFRPKGVSMLPFIQPDRDNVVLKKRETVSVGDIVLADLGGKYVLHRVIREDGDRLTLMGDGNIKGTESCARKDILGTVVCIMKKGRKPVVPGKGKLWRTLLPFRRYILAFYKRVLM